MIRSLLVRNALSALLLVVAVVGVLVQLQEIRRGFITPQTRLVLVAYIMIALYAMASIAVRWRAARTKR